MVRARRAGSRPPVQSTCRGSAAVCYPTTLSNMSSIRWHVGAQEVPGGVLVHLPERDECALPEPIWCPAGHRYLPGRMIVGTARCLAVGGSHTTWTCMVEGCERVVMWPPFGDQCDHRWFDGR